MSQKYTNQFGETFEAKVENGAIVFYCDDPIIHEQDHPWHLEFISIGCMVVNAMGVFAIVSEDELAWMLRMYLAFLDVSRIAEPA